MIALRTLPRPSAASIALVFAEPSGATGKPGQSSCAVGGCAAPRGAERRWQAGFGVQPQESGEERDNGFIVGSTGGRDFSPAKDFAFAFVFKGNCQTDT